METNPAPVGKRIAIIVDDGPLREALALFLRVKSWTVDAFRTGEESSWVGNWDEYTVVICDFSLPREDGLSVLRRVREASDKIVTVLITAFADGDITARAESAGVDRILSKPFSTMELVESLRGMTEIRSGGGAMTFASPQ